MLPRELAKKLILEEIGRRILENPAWRKAVHDEALKAWDEFQSEVPSELQAAHDQLREIDRKISNLVDQIEEGDAPSDVKDRLALRRDEKDQLLRHIGELQGRAKQTPRTLTPEQIDEGAQGFARSLVKWHSCRGNRTWEPHRRRRRLPGLAGRDENGPFIRASLSYGLAASSIPSTERTGWSPKWPGRPRHRGRKDHVDFVEPDPKYETSDRVKEALRQGTRNWEIAEQLDLDRSRVTLLFEVLVRAPRITSSGPPRPAQKKAGATPLYQQLADEAKSSGDQGCSEREIARRLNTTDMTVRNAIGWWHRSRNRPAPRFKDRRQTQVELAGSMREAGCTLDEISSKMKRTVPTVRKMLDEWYAAKPQGPA